MERHPMTVKGHAALEAELKELKTVRRPQVVQAIAEARAHGDLKENAEYHAAREQQGFIEGRIQDIEAKLGAAQVIDVVTMTNEGRVIFGATVHVENMDTQVKTIYQIVGEDEADIKINKISYKAPIARALIGKSEGDVIEFHAPSGPQSLEIVSVLYA